MLIDHVSLGVSDFERAGCFYDAVMAVLGCERGYVIDNIAIAYGDKPTLWIQSPENQQPAAPGNGNHIAFAAETVIQV